MRKVKEMSRFRFGIYVLLALGLVIGAVSVWSVYENRQSVRQASAVPELGGDFRLTDHTGKSVTQADYAGKYVLIFFGYTFCPDVCPTGLQTVASALDELGDDVDRVQPLFVSVDPLRDTPDVMAEYVDAFHPRMIGLTGTDRQIRDIAKAYRVYYASGRDPDSKTPAADDDYLVSHSAFTYLMGPDTKFRFLFPHGTTPEQMSEKIRQTIAADS